MCRASSVGPAPPPSPPPPPPPPPPLPRQDEQTCIGCKQCVWCAPATFRIESDYGRSRVFGQWLDKEDDIQVCVSACVACVCLCVACAVCPRC